ncbi:hypothetical protein HK099_004792 [Clydaea vesicula]|uniref:Shugoshin C-terminal domain-containing protein n=1 Tax=Clydaea vesicula TaxID=447962 RepID=A0AAD5U6W0_9FUNG|nr:hypothetical protein HK099_004792 [Clydaea vesicula]
MKEYHDPKKLQQKYFKQNNEIARENAKLLTKIRKLELEKQELDNILFERDKEILNLNLKIKDTNMEKLEITKQKLLLTELGKNSLENVNSLLEICKLSSPKKEALNTVVEESTSEEIQDDYTDIKTAEVVTADRNVLDDVTNTPINFRTFKKQELELVKRNISYSGKENKVPKPYSPSSPLTDVGQKTSKLQVVPTSGNLFKNLKSEEPEVPVPKRTSSRTATSSVNYKLPSLNRKLRQGDHHTISDISASTPLKKYKSTQKKETKNSTCYSKIKKNSETFLTKNEETDENFKANLEQQNFFLDKIDESEKNFNLSFGSIKVGSLVNYEEEEESDSFSD